MKIINVNVSESEWYEMKSAKEHARRIKSIYQDFVTEPTNEPTVQIPDTLWKAIEALIRDEDIRADLHKE